MSSEKSTPKRSFRTKSVGASCPARTGLLALIVAGLIFPVAACAASGGDAPPVSRSATSTGSVEAVEVARFESPVEVRRAPGYPKLLFVVEKAGRVMVVKSGRRLDRPFLDIRGRVSSGGEQGLLSIAFPPDYPETKRFYLYFTDRDGDIRIEEFRRTSSTTAGATGRRVIEIPHSTYGNHNGGQMRFLGRQLYFGTGDGGGGGDPDGNAQNVDSLLGKLLRIDPAKSGDRPYSVPASNPFAAGPGRDEIFSTGLRNPYRWSFDLRQADEPMLLLPDVGQDEWEELNYLPLEEARGANFGWNAFEGRSPFDGFDGTRPTGTIVPRVTLPHSGNCSIIGGLVVRDPNLPALQGRYLFADFCRSSLLSTAGRPGDGAPVSSTGIPMRLVSSIGEGSGNRVYVTSVGGGLYRLR